MIVIVLDLTLQKNYSEVQTASAKANDLFICNDDKTLSDEHIVSDVSSSTNT